MDAVTLRKIVSEIEPLKEHIEYLLKIAKPCIDIDLVPEATTPECSRFGGNPFVPINFQLPVHKEGEYRFLGQINFSEIVNPPSILPKFGLLSIFYAYDEDGEIFWEDDEYILGFYWDDLTNHTIIKLQTKDTPKTQRIKLTKGLNLPFDSELRDDWTFDTSLLWDLFEKIDPNGEYLLGYPSFNTLAYDPTPGDEWISLLTVCSLEEFDWCWHDGDRLMVFIEIEKLAKCDFSYLKSDAG